MAQKTLSMRRLREVLHLKHERGLSNRKIGASLKISHAMVAAYLRRAERAGVEWSLPDWPHVYRELGRHKGVTLELLWLEYKQVHPDGYQYSHFCDLYRQWCQHRRKSGQKQRCRSGHSRSGWDQEVMRTSALGWGVRRPAFRRWRRR